jgi:hypothetical protein
VRADLPGEKDLDPAAGEAGAGDPGTADPDGAAPSTDPPTGTLVPDDPNDDCPGGNGSGDGSGDGSDAGTGTGLSAACAVAPVATGTQKPPDGVVTPGADAADQQTSSPSVDGTSAALAARTG